MVGVLLVEVILFSSLEEAEVGHAVFDLAGTFGGFHFTCAPPTVHILASED